MLVEVPSGRTADEQRGHSVLIVYTAWGPTVGAAAGIDRDAMVRDRGWVRVPGRDGPLSKVVVIDIQVKLVGLTTSEHRDRTK